MKMHLKLAVVFAILLVISDSFPPLTAKAKNTSEKARIQADLSLASDETSSKEPDIPDEAPTFSANIEYSPQGYHVKGRLTGFSSDIILIQTLYSLDQKSYQLCSREWDLDFLKPENADGLTYLQNNYCLYSNEDPLKSYLEGKFDHFYLKLRLTRKNGVTYETQTALIDRSVPQAVPEGSALFALFASNIRVRETKPFRYCARYQLTVSENATPEDIAAFLPDTLPIEVQILSEDLGSSAIGIVDYPVAWKPLSLPQLTAGESLTISDAAEEIVIPSGTLVNTPLGIFELNEPLHMNQTGVTDEIQLILNVVGKEDPLTGALSEENAGLEMAFHLKATGAASIQAYTLLEGESEWTELPCPALQSAINAQPSTANSGYALVLGADSEPYQSYLAAETAGNEPTPFFIGLKIEGGTYHGRQLILAWPDTYELPPNLPNVGASGGNEGNAGSDNKNDSTPTGQRPNLPQNQDDKSEELPPGNLQNTENKPGNQQTVKPGNTKGKSKNQHSVKPENTKDKPDKALKNKPGDETQQEQTERPVSGGFDISSHIPVISQTIAGIEPKETNAAAPHTKNTVTSAPDRITESPSAPQKDHAPSALNPSVTEKKMSVKSDAGKTGLLLFIPPIVVAAVCIAAIYITAAAKRSR